MLVGERSRPGQRARGAAAHRAVVLHRKSTSASGSRILMLAVGCVLLAAQCRADGHEAVGCGEGDQTVVECPRVTGQLKATIASGRLSSELPPQARPCRGREQICYLRSVTQDVGCADGTDLRGRIEDTQSQTKNALMEIKPGKGTVCGHGNREFSFFVQVQATEHKKVLVVFLNGGTCWDSSCKDRMTLNSDNMVTSTTPGVLPIKEPSPASPTFFKTQIGNRLSQGVFGDLDDEWAIWIIPDCTGDDHIGNRSITYDAGEDTCFTAHHKGGVNTGIAIDYLLDNIAGLEQVVLLGTGNNPEEAYNRGMGGVGAAFWAKYFQDRLPSARVRTILDSAMGIYGPEWKNIHRNDPWGAKNVFVPPDARLMGRHHHPWLLPPENEWSLAEDDMTAYYRWATDKSPSLAFADVSSTDDPVQIDGFVRTGGRVKTVAWRAAHAQARLCMVSGAGGWIGPRQVQVLQRTKTMPNNYRAWLRSGDKRFLLSLLWPGIVDHTPVQQERLNFCPRLPIESAGVCPTEYMLRNWFIDFYLGTVVRDGAGTVIGNTFQDTGYGDRAFGLSICENCLHGVPGGLGEMEESCNATFYSGESLFTVAAKYHTDWMALWSLNGAMSPDALATGTSYRFAHEYIVQKGDTAESIAARFGTTVEAIVELNFNTIAHINNPLRLQHGDRICLVPDFATHKDRMGNPVCSPSDPRMQAAGGTI